MPVNRNTQPPLQSSTKELTMHAPSKARTTPRRFALRAVAAIGMMAAATAAFSQVTVKMVFGAPLTTLHLPIIVAEQEGYFKEAGVTLDKIFLAGDANSLRAVASGDADVASTGMLTLISAVAAGSDIRGIFSVQPVADYNIIAKDPAATFKTLGGKSFASSGPLDMTTEIPKMVMRKHGVDPASVKFIQIGGHSARLQAVAAGKVDASMVNTYTATQGAKMGNVKVLGSVAQDVQNIGYSICVTSKKTLADPAKRKNLEAITEGVMRGARFIMKEPDKAAEMMKKVSPDMDLDILKATFRQLNADGVWGINGGVERPVIDFTAQVAKDIGTAPKVIAYDDLIDPTVVNAALKKLGKQ
jgi:NitT/TauT family transport system substrate-binding protein